MQLKTDQVFVEDPVQRMQATPNMPQKSKPVKGAARGRGLKGLKQSEC